MLAFVKVLIAAAVFGLSAHYGFKASKKYAERELYFSELVLFCRSLAGEIGFMRAPLPLIFEKYAAAFKSALAAQLKAAGDLIGADDAIDEKNLWAALPRGSLRPTEYDAVLAFFNGLGKSDAENQIGSAAGFRAAFDEYHKQTLADKKKFAPLYWKLGLLGAGAVVILIL
ncbi:MAG: stage III sporulation protein AB [Clostridiales bacterium]|jgi:stage III sporulation protein AB|nr:stage III sporulation protein AB [Clostridiales bacterium]